MANTAKPKRTPPRKPAPEKRPERRPLPPHDCRGCTITAIAPYPPFPAGRTTLRLPISVGATAELTLTAVPSDPACPCEWRNQFQIAGHRVATGATTLTRTTLNAGPSPLIETLRPRLTNLQPFFTIAGCALTIKVQDLDTTLRQGIGLANNVVMIEMGLQVRCDPKGRWRNVRIVFSD